MSFPVKRFVDHWCTLRLKDGTKIAQKELDFVLAAISGKWPSDDSPRSAEPAWLVEARARIGEKEIPGPRHNTWIAKGWKRLGSWFTDDETPWCGFFVAHCLDHAGLQYPKMFPRAIEWSTWGKACAPTVGAVVVFGRKGGGHVGFLVGESINNFYVLGGNQGNMVSITPIAKNRMVAIRWPLSLGLPTPGLPQMTGGTVSTNEA